MTFLPVPWQHPFAGTSRSRRRVHFIPAPSNVGRTSPTSRQSRRRVRQQRSVHHHQRLSALSDPAKTIPCQSSCRAKSPWTAKPSSLSRGFLLRRLSDAGSLPGVDRSRRAGIRNPSRNQPFARHGPNESNRPFAALRARSYERAGCARKRSSAEGAGWAIIGRSLTAFRTGPIDRSDPRSLRFAGAPTARLDTLPQVNHYPIEPYEARPWPSAGSFAIRPRQVPGGVSRQRDRPARSSMTSTRSFTPSASKPRDICLKREQNPR
jgi:hypothetical protein